MKTNGNTISLKFRKGFFKDYAENQECMIRVARCAGLQCDHGTTVLCHPSIAGLKAMGKRSSSVPDIGGAWGCLTCHSIVDGRITTDIHKDTLRLYHLEGVERTIHALVKAGVLPNP